MINLGGHSSCCLAQFLAFPKTQAPRVAANPPAPCDGPDYASPNGGRTWGGATISHYWVLSPASEWQLRVELPRSGARAGMTADVKGFGYRPGASGRPG